MFPLVFRMLRALYFTLRYETFYQSSHLSLFEACVVRLTRLWKCEFLLGNFAIHFFFSWFPFIHSFSHGNKEVFSCLGIQLTVNFFLDRGHTEVTVFVPSWRKEQPRPDVPITGKKIFVYFNHFHFLLHETQHEPLRL